MPGIERRNRCLLGKAIIGSTHSLSIAHWNVADGKAPTISIPSSFPFVLLAPIMFGVWRIRLPFSLARKDFAGIVHFTIQGMALKGPRDGHLTPIDGLQAERIVGLDTKWFTQFNVEEALC